MTKKLTPVQRLIQSATTYAHAVGSARHINGFRSAQPKTAHVHFNAELAEWKKADIALRDFRRLCQRVIQEARKEERKKK